MYLKMKWCLLIAAFPIMGLCMSQKAHASRVYCSQLQSRKAYFLERYQTYRTRYHNCRNRGWSHRGCRYFRRKYKTFRAEYRQAWQNYVNWRCSRYFVWRRYNWDGNGSQTGRCRALAARVQRWQNIRNRYLQSWQRCKWNQGRHSPRCQHLRNQVTQWYGRVRVARGNYRAWGCRFVWNSWSDPWARRRAARHRVARCNTLATRVARWRDRRNRYLRRWRRCRWRRGRYSRRCQYLREKVTQWYNNVRVARSNYQAWGCRFAWGQWNDPWQSSDQENP